MPNHQQGGNVFFILYYTHQVIALYFAFLYRDSGTMKNMNYLIFFQQETKQKGKIMNQNILMLLCLLAFMPFMTGAKESNVADSNKAMVEKQQPMHFESKGSVRIDGKNIDYTATAGTLVMKNNKDELIAQFGYTAYVQNGIDKSNRPILFAYNG
ncbi:hypothetical protein MNBD_GAMMA02-1135 [hydrothermal vent metagenome]|uniref:Uncharacterized protein n=1 Tax=hydrothermal vent metagenome TaxID=652676 RepID=A0A3B0WJL6_9ZZZZ